ncbi:MAG: carbohydrate ABC transporter permease [Hyphomicrobiales bacterium]|nr:carbohydrate ABC transporter permease [Hyphomicrobiales bacterium]
MVLGTQGRRAGLVFVSVLSLVWIVPILIMLTVAFMPADQRAPKFGGLLIEGLSLHNFITVFGDAPIFRHFVNSLVITVSSVAFVVLVGSLAAYAFARLRFAGKEIWFYLLITTLMLPVPALIVPMFQINKGLGLLDSYLGLILPYVALGTPFAIIILRSFFEALPKELEEAALVDGASRFRIYWQIVMPLSWPALSVVVIFQFMTSFNEFILALVTIDDAALKPLTLVPLIYSGQFMARPGSMFAVLTLITIPVIAVYVLMQRFLVRGLTAGAVKG